MCHLIWLLSRKYGTVWYHPASFKLWYLTLLSFVNFQEKLTGTSRDSLRVWSQLVSACCVFGARCTFCVNKGNKHYLMYVLEFSCCTLLWNSCVSHGAVITWWTKLRPFFNNHVGLFVTSCLFLLDACVWLPALITVPICAWCCQYFCFIPAVN
jgi:hypothetical protein